MDRLLITGASGFLGWNLCQQAVRCWEVHGTYRSHLPDLSQINWINSELTDRAALENLFETVKPDAIIHLAAESRPNSVQGNPELSHRANVTLPIALAKRCAKLDIPFVFTSTDFVFDGKNAPYAEPDSTSPLSLYGEQKVMAEAGILSAYPKAAVCRMPLMFGAAGVGASSFLQPFLKTLREGGELRLFVDEFRTPVSGQTAACGLLLALEKEVKGLLHLGGKERISRHAFGQLMTQVFELPKSGIVAIRQADLQMAAPRPADVSLDSRRAFELGYEVRSLFDQLSTLKGLV